MLGVLGGMGPLATVDFLEKLIRQTPASRDQEHMPFVAACLPQIPDRSDAILHGTATPFPALVDGVRRLLAAGATFIAIPCNTAHAWYPQLATCTAVPILHIADAAIDALRARGIVDGRVGLLATTGTIQAGIYQDRLRRSGLECRLPARQDAVMDSIRQVKAGNLTRAAQFLRGPIADLIEGGCSAIVLACSELPIIADRLRELETHGLDASAALARAALRHARREAAVEQPEIQPIVTGRVPS